MWCFYALIVVVEVTGCFLKMEAGVYILKCGCRVASYLESIACGRRQYQFQRKYSDLFDKVNNFVDGRFNLESC